MERQHQTKIDKSIQSKSGLKSKHISVEKLFDNTSGSFTPQSCVSVSISLMAVNITGEMKKTFHSLLW